jgi:hypothetical protein
MLDKTREKSSAKPSQSRSPLHPLQALDRKFFLDDNGRHYNPLTEIFFETLIVVNMAVDIAEQWKRT